MHAPIALSGEVVEDQWTIVENVEEQPEQLATARAQLQELQRRRYRIEWFNYPGSPQPAQHALAWFTDDMGFDREDQEGILELQVGEAYSSGIGETIRVVRLPND